MTDATTPNNDDARRLITPAGILSYPHLDQPDRYQKTGQPRYRANLLLAAHPETGETAREQCKPLLAAVTAAAHDKFGTSDLSGLRLPMEAASPKDAELLDDLGAVVVKTMALAQPALFDEHADRLDPDDPKTFENVFYAGAVVRLSVWATGYDVGQNTGVTLVLNGVQKVADGTPLASGRSGKPEFQPVKTRPAKRNAFDDPPAVRQDPPPIQTTTTDGMPF